MSFSPFFRLIAYSPWFVAFLTNFSEKVLYLSLYLLFIIYTHTTCCSFPFSFQRSHFLFTTVHARCCLKFRRIGNSYTQWLVKNTQGDNLLASIVCYSRWISRNWPEAACFVAFLQSARREGVSGRDSVQ